MVTISPTLEAKIERRARRAWRDHKDDPSRRFHRITNVTDTELEYRVPYTPSYRGSKRVKVALVDDNIVIDPPTTDRRDLLKTSDIAKLKNDTDKLHQGEIVGYIIADKAKTVGKTYKKTSGVMSRQRAEDGAEHDNFVYVVQVAAGDLKDIKHDACEVAAYTIERQLDHVKDLGFSDGLVDVLTKSDIKKIKRHTDIFHAYVRVKPKGKDLTVGLTVDKQYQVLDLDAIKDEVKRGDRVYRIEAHVDAVVKVNYANIEVSGFQVRDELDPEKDLGFTTGLYDCRTKSDVAKLRKRKHLGRVRAYKYVTDKLESPTNSSKIKYEVGKEFKVKNADTNDGQTCGAGINLGSADWCQGFADKKLHRALAFEFEMEDIAAIPTDGGKFRVHRCDCVEEVDIKDFKASIKQASPSDDKKAKKKGFMDKLLGRGDDDP